MQNIAQNWLAIIIIIIKNWPLILDSTSGSVCSASPSESDSESEYSPTKDKPAEKEKKSQH